ncbi:LPXTG cell wall anchor domain-containing protein [Erysipelothrix sp. HDW6A]|uniref:InlB B-repeat-containing protein n=1 Tax=Erysipelothrix sp. HDW6A TaxID=2714928 RepID=UPI00140D46EE|nr:InlB B-repeat-containing protein [Erysipelothrix sp. HDW6A]QIK57066.1 LPXTG cell wall anchor domain-containing protein [Erysipelothrix sp. HDW6A]
MKKFYRLLSAIFLIAVLATSILPNANVFGLEESDQEETVVETTNTIGTVPVGTRSAILNGNQLKAAIENATEDTTIILDDLFDVTSLGGIDINKTNTFNVTVDGNNKVYTSVKDSVITISGNAGGTLTFENFILDGSLKSKNLKISIKNTFNDVVIRNSEFRESKTTPIAVNGTGTLTVEESYFHNNNASFGGGIEIYGASNIIVKNSTFENNENTYGGYDGGAISSKSHSGKLEVYNSKFINNIATGAGSVAGGRGGAIAAIYPSGHTIIKDSFFYGNQASTNISLPISDGGAIAVVDMAMNATYTIENSTFEENQSGDDGGAILFQGKGANAVFTVKNSTFFKNSAHGKGNDAGLSGGAIQLYANSGMKTVLDSNTFVENTAFANTANQDQVGGAVAASGRFGGRAAELTNNLFVSNHVFSSPGIEDVSSKAKNLNMGIDKGGNIGLDKGLDIVYSSNIDAFGVNTPVLSHNGSTVKAGRTADAVVVPTLMIVPNVGQNETNIVNPDGEGSTILTLDQRGLPRGNDVGAVEISKIIYNANGGSFDLGPLGEYLGSEYYVGSSPTEYYQVGYIEKNEAVVNGTTVLKATNPGQVFLGWSSSSTATEPDAGLSVGSSIQMSQEDQVLYAVWGEETYTVSFESNGGSTVQPITDITKDSTITSPTDPSKAGYTFAGWYTDVALTTAWNFGTDTVTSNITLYAKWNEVLYTVSFESNGGSTVQPITDITKDSTITSPTDPKKAGYTFAGWYTDIALTTVWNFGTDTVTSNITLYAKWNEVLYTVSFESNGGSTVQPITDITKDSTITSPTNPSKVGYTFAGWYTDVALTTAWNFDTDTVTSNITLYAKWNEVTIPVETYTVSFVSNGGTAVLPITDVTKGSTIASPANPSKGGYTFAGWYTDAAFTTAWNFVTDTVTSNITLYAKWSAVVEVTPSPGPTLPSTGISNNNLIIALSLMMIGMTGLVIRDRKKKHTN